MQVNLHMMTNTKGKAVFIGATDRDMAVSRVLNAAGRLLKRLDALDGELFDQLAAGEECADLVDDLAEVRRVLAKAHDATNEGRV